MRAVRSVLEPANVLAYEPLRCSLTLQSLTCSAALLAVLPVAASLGLACSSAQRGKDSEMSPNGASGRPAIEIRVRNESAFDFERVRVRFPETGEADYGAVPSGGLSAFHDTTLAYRYAPVVVKTGDRELAFQPIDYVGERKLDVGRYTYALGVDSGVLTIKLEREP